ncbi:MAG: acyl-[acyl-carrier-protein]--UDP-N-acetylglucosamine O-acyltransferase [Proteobacteria bacterium]|nr:MAG: acyl-[acyl-carrier-protein]--UDP-N-acetylglucosamine O-acyltransferase [Pseudomonadota bacterium]
MSVSIHPSSVVSDKAELGENVSIGPFCVVDEHVRVGDGTQLISHVVLSGHTTLGKNNRIFPFASLGHEPQDLKYHGEPSEVVIGDGNTIRENVTINPGTEGGGMMTRLGNNNLLMAYSHVAHDCLLADDIIMANCATLAGHVHVDDGAIIGGMSAIHQFLRIGRYAMIGGMSGIVKDVPPFCLTAGGYRPGLAGLNLVGLKRQGLGLERIRTLKEVYRILLQSNDSLDQRLAEAKVLAEGDDLAEHLVAFVSTSKKGLTVHRRDQS